MNQKSLQEEERFWFCIAGHFMELVVPRTFDWEGLLLSFKPFKSYASNGKVAMCSIRVVEQPIAIEQDSAKVLNEVSDVLGHWFCLKETEQNYIFDIEFIEKGNRYRMVSDKMFSTATAYIDRKDPVAGIVLSSFLMIAFAQSAVLHKTLLIHSSVIEKDRKGYAFLGKSGTGKSTHSSLWLRYIENTDLLNDDNPAIRIEENGNVYVYGTPWSGKTPCYKNRRAELKALVRLEQAPENHFIWKEGVDSLITLLPSCSSMRWNTLLYTGMCNILEEVIDKVKVGYLKCLPDKDAALVCYKEVQQV
ncbi:MAG: phosphoenolpyruvate carboxykinase [Dysgonamonadaceae bacterium]|nr:phosphoenolpyruvate carboxykinase [Dysgonamonadaceae bacterium]